MDSRSVLKQIKLYQQATSQQEQDQFLYQIAISSQLFNPREVNQITQRGGDLSEEQRQRVLGYVEVYFNLNLE